jgi:hypothetical protein
MIFKNKDTYLIIPDLHIPDHNEQAFDFIADTIRFFKIPMENRYSLGDEVEFAAFSMHPKGADYTRTPNQELEEVRLIIKKFARVVGPDLKICYSNHVSRYWRKAYQAEITTQALRPYRELIDAPSTWVWKDHFRVPSEHPFLLFHGEGYSGTNGHRQAALNYGISTAMGHLHSQASVSWVNTRGQDIWACNAGCLIDIHSPTFSYAANARFKPSIGLLVVTEGGKIPLWVPLHGG